MSDASPTETDPLNRLNAAVRRIDALKTLVKAAAVFLVIYLVYSLFFKAFPTFDYYVATVFEIGVVILLGGIGVSYLQRQKEYHDPNLYLNTWGNYEKTRGLQLRNKATEVFIDKARDIPMTLDQVTQLPKLLKQFEGDKEEEPTTYVPRN